MTVEEIIWHYEFGKDSGIPKCCIIFWLEEHCPFFEQEYYLDPTDWDRKREEKFGVFPVVGYVPCKKCIENGTFNEIIECPPKEPHPQSKSSSISSKSF